MEVPIIKIGNSRGLRLSKDLLERYHIKDRVELIFEEGKIIIQPIDSPRLGWAEAFKEMNDNEEDKLLFDDVFEDENLEEWN